MTLRQLGSLAIAFAAGFLIASLAHPDGKSDAPPVGFNAGASIASIANDEGVRAAYKQQIADLKSELEAVRLQAATATGVGLPVVRTTEERLRLAEESREKRFAATQQLETDKLLAAGFSVDRIAWIRKRTEELQAQFRQAEDLRKQQGKLDPDSAISHLYDSDIDLRHEIGDDEYEKYRQALGRPIGVKVGGVLAGGIGETAGLQAGDEIIAYNGTRVFNIGELNPLLRQYTTSGTYLSVDVRRNGQKVRLSAAGGSLGIRSAEPVLLTEELNNIAKDVNAKLIEAARARKAQAASK